MRVVATALAVVGLAAVTGCGTVGAKPTTTTTRQTLASQRFGPIDDARASNPRLFFIFPSKPGSKTCAIPEGGVHRTPATLAGTCFTGIHRKNIARGPASVVTFTEYWTVGSPCRPGEACALIRGYEHTWQVVVGGTNRHSTHPRIPGVRDRPARRNRAAVLQVAARILD